MSGAELFYFRRHLLVPTAAGQRGYDLLMGEGFHAQGLEKRRFGSVRVTFACLSSSLMSPICR